MSDADKDKKAGRVKRFASPEEAVKYLQHEPSFIDYLQGRDDAIHIEVGRGRVPKTLRNHRRRKMSECEHNLEPHDGSRMCCKCLKYVPEENKKYPPTCEVKWKDEEGNDCKLIQQADVFVVQHRWISKIHEFAAACMYESAWRAEWRELEENNEYELAIDAHNKACKWADVADKWRAK